MVYVNVINTNFEVISSIAKIKSSHLVKNNHKYMIIYYLSLLKIWALVTSAQHINLKSGQYIGKWEMCLDVHLKNILKLFYRIWSDFHKFKLRCSFSAATKVTMEKVVEFINKNKQLLIQKDKVRCDMTNKENELGEVC